MAFKYLIVNEDGELMGTNDVEVADHFELGGCVVYEPGFDNIPEASAPEDVEDDKDDEDGDPVDWP